MSPLMLFMNTTAFWAAAFSAPVLLCFSGYFVYRAFAAKRSYRKLDRESAKKIANKAILYLIGSVSAVAYCVYAYSQNPAASKFANLGGVGVFVLGMCSLVLYGILAFISYKAYHKWVGLRVGQNSTRNRRESVAWACLALVIICFYAGVTTYLKETNSSVANILFIVGMFAAIPLLFTVSSFDNPNCRKYSSKSATSELSSEEYNLRPPDYIHDPKYMEMEGNLFHDKSHDDSKWL